MIRSGGDRNLEASDDLRNMVLVEFLNRRFELMTFLALNEELSNLGAPLEVFRTDFPDFTLFGALFFCGSRLKCIFGECAFMLLESRLGL